MPIQQQAFVDVRETLLRSGANAPFELDAAQVQRIEQAVGQSNGAAIVYFAPGEYRVHRIRRSYEAWQGDLNFGPGVTVWMDPDAILVLDSARLVLMGGLNAPPSKIFDERGHGMVLLGGEIKEVLPEWWGANVDAMRDNTDPIQRAIDAASARRMPRSNKSSQRGRQLRPLPVLLRQMFTVGRSIVVGRVVEPDPAESILTGFGALAGVSLTLRGLVTGIATHAVGLRALDWRALRVGDDQDALTRTLEQTLLRLDFAYGALIENLTLDANGQVDYAAMIYSGVGEPRPEQTHAITLRGCTFRGARRVQVQFGPAQIQGTPPTRPRTVGVGAEQVTVQIPSEIVTTGNGDIPGLNVRNCVVECRAIESLDPPRGMHFRTENGVALRVADTVFRGSTQCFIDITSGMVLVDGCDFDNPSSSTKSAGKTTMAIASGFEPPEGQDVYLGALGSLTDGSPPQSGNGFVAMSSCTSNSDQLMATPYPSRQGINNGRPMRSNLIWGCRHEPPGTSGRVSVRWGRLALSGRVDSGSERRYNSDGTLCVIGGYMGGEIQAITRAAQSVVLACRTSATDNLPKIVAPRPPGTRSMTTVIFGLQSVALVLLILCGVGCQQEPRTSSTDIGADRALVDEAEQPTHDARHTTQVDNGIRADVRARPDVVIADPPDSGVWPDAGASDTGAMDIPVPDAVPDVPNEDARRYTDPQWAMLDVVQRDIEVALLPDASIVDDFGPPRQMRANCPAVTDGDATIAAPRLLFPLSPMRATSRRPTLFWSLPPGVDGARIDLCRDRCCTRSIATLDVNGSSVQPPQALPPGVVFWRARGRIGTRVGRDTSFTWEFGVKHRDAPIDTAWGTIKDFNGDGFDDLVAMFPNGSVSDQARIYWGSTDGLSGDQFRAFSAERNGTKAAVGDFNGDGLADAVIISGRIENFVVSGETRATSYARAFYGNGEAIRGDQNRFRVGNRTIAVADFNGDGYSDVAVSRGGQPINTQALLLQTMIVMGGPAGLGSGGQQVFSDPQGQRLQPHYGRPASAGDLNGDGYADLLVGDPSFPYTRGTVYVFAGTAQGVHASPATIVEANSPIHMPGVAAGIGETLAEVGDIDGDRIGDVVIGTLFTRSREVYRGSRQSFLAYATSLLPPDRDQSTGGTFGREPPIAPDLDGDGRADLGMPCAACGTVEVGHPDYMLGYYYVYQYDPSTMLRPTPVLVVRGEREFWDRHQTFGTGSAAGDYNGDGFDDLAIGDGEFCDPSRTPCRGKVFVVLGGLNVGIIRVLTIYGESLGIGLGSGLGEELARSDSLGWNLRGRHG